MQAQKLAKEGKSLIEARAQYQQCAAATCKPLRRDDCNAGIAEMNRRIPTVLFIAKRGREEVVEVAVSVDGKTVASRLDGIAIELDPGKHDFNFTFRGESVTVAQTVTEGTKGQAVTATFAEPVAPAPSATAASASSTAPTTATPTPPTAAVSPAPTVVVAVPSAMSPVADRRPTEDGGPQRTVGIFSTIVGAGGVVVGGLLYGFAASDQTSALKSTDPATYNSDGTRGNIGLGLLIGGGVLAVGGLVLWATAPSGGSPSAATAKIQWSPSGVSLTGTF